MMNLRVNANNIDRLLLIKNVSEAQIPGLHKLWVGD